MMTRGIKITRDVFVWILILAAGAGVMGIVVGVFARNDPPNMGYYYGKVHARLAGIDDEAGNAFCVRFAGESKQEWYFCAPTNFQYQSLTLQCERFRSSGSNEVRLATVSLPSLAYVSGDETGMLTIRVLSEWLIGSIEEHASTNDLRRVEAVLEYLVSAGRGTLPRPRHHSYYAEKPLNMWMMHICLGVGISGFVWMWVIVWTCLFVNYGHRHWKTKDKA